MAGYIGIQPTPQATQTRDTFTATSNQASFPTSGYTPEFLDVFMNGVHLLNGVDYTASNGSDVVLTVGATAGDIIEVVAYSTFTLTDQTFTGTTTLGSTLRAPSTFTIDPAVHGANSGTVVIAGDLTVNGTTTTINSTSISSADKNITLGAGGTASGNDGAGITIDGASASLTYVHSGTKFLFNKDLHITGGLHPTQNLELNTNYRVRWNDSNNYSIMSDANNYIRTYIGGAQILSAESTGITVTGEIDASTLLKVGVNDTEYANNYIRFKPTGAAYIDHNTAGQVINFRVTASSALDTTPLVVKAAGIAVAGTVEATGISTSGTFLKTGTNGNYTIAANGNDFYYGRNGTNYHIAGTANGGFQFLTGSSSLEALRITSAQNVNIARGKLSIGTTGTPTSHLDIRGSGDVDMMSKIINTQQTTNGRKTEFLFGKDNGANLSGVLKYVYEGTQADRRIDLVHYGTSNGLSILDGGNVGINEIAPATKLHVVGGTSNSTMYETAVFAGGANSTSGSGARIRITGCENDPLSRGTIIEGKMVDNQNSHELNFYTSAAASAPAKRLTIDQNGNVYVKGAVNLSTTAGNTNFQVLTTNSQAANLGGSIGMGGVYNATNQITFAEIHGKKENSTAANLKGYMAFVTRDDGGSSEKMRITSTGNVGIAKTSLATWSSGYKALQIGGRGFVGAHTGSDLYLGQNSSFNGGWKYEASVAASLTQHSGGKITHFVAPAGTAGNAITWNRAIDINPTGEVAMGLTPSNGIALKIGNSANNSAITRITNGTVHVDLTASSSGKAFLEVGTNHPLILATNAQERMNITTSGYIHMAGASDVRLTLGSQGTAGNNDANWIRGNASTLSYNSASGDHYWEVGGAEKMRLLADGQLRVNRSTTAEYATSFRNTADNLQLLIGTTTGGLLNIQGKTINNGTAYGIALQGEGGNVGIGDLAPDRKVSIVGENNTTNSQYPLSLDAVNTDYTLEFRRNGTSEWWIRQSSSGFHIHENGDGDHLTVKSGGSIGIATTDPKAVLEIRGKNEAEDATDSDDATGAEIPITMIRGANGGSAQEWVHSTKAVAPGVGTQTAMISWYRFDLPGGWSGTGTPGLLEVTNQISGMHSSGNAVDRFMIIPSNSHSSIQLYGGLQNTQVYRTFAARNNSGSYTTSLSTVFYYGNHSSHGYAQGSIFMKVTHASREPIFTMYAKYIGGTGSNRNYLQKLHFLGTEATNNHVPSTIHSSPISITDSAGGTV